MRTLRRPMFRMGGSANQGITSGLEKPKRGLVDEPGSYSVTEQMEELYKFADEAARRRRPKETYKDRDDFLINLGLDLVSRQPSGNIISTIGESAKGPFKQYQTAQATKRKTLKPEKKAVTGASPQRLQMFLGYFFVLLIPPC